MLKNNPRFYGILSDGGPRAYTVDTQRHEAKGYGAFYDLSESQRGFPNDILASRPMSKEQRIFGETADVVRLRAANYA